MTQNLEALPASDDTDSRRAALSGERTLATRPPSARRYALLLTGLSCVWGVLLSQFGQAPIYWLMGPYAVAASIALLTVRGRALRKLVRPNLKNVALGAAVGVAMTLATYPAFSAAQAAFPALFGNVSQLYRQSHDEWLPTALLWTVLILAAEELLWRGAWVEALTPRYGRAWAGAASVLLYAGAQLCSRSFIVGLLALACGTVWSVLRHTSNSLVAPLLAHLIWTPTVILLVPVV